MPEIQDPIAQIYWQRIESIHTPWRIRVVEWAKKILRGSYIVFTNFWVVKPPKVRRRINYM